MPLKVCRNTAEEIRWSVRRSLTVLPKLPPEVVRQMKIATEIDARIHKEYDTHFIMGNGPAVERRK